MIESVRSGTTTTAAQRPTGGSKDIRGAEASQRVEASHAADSPGSQDQSRMHGDERHPPQEPVAQDVSEDSEVEASAREAEAASPQASSREPHGTAETTAALAQLIEEASAVDVPPEDSEGKGQAGKPKRNAPSTPGPNEAAPTGILSRAATAYRTGLEIGGSGKRVLKPGEVYSERL